MGCRWGGHEDHGKGMRDDRVWMTGSGMTGELIEQADRTKTTNKAHHLWLLLTAWSIVALGIKLPVLWRMSLLSAEPQRPVPPRTCWVLRFGQSSLLFLLRDALCLLQAGEREESSRIQVPYRISVFGFIVQVLQDPTHPTTPGGSWITQEMPFVG